MNTDFIVDYTSIRETKLAINSQGDAYNKILCDIQKTIRKLAELDSFQGKTATAVKGYFTELYPVIITGIQQIISAMMTSLCLLEQRLQDEVDSDIQAYIPQAEMDSVISNMDRQFFALDDIADEINSVLNTIADLGSFTRVNTESLADAGDAVKKNIQRVEEQVERIDRYFLNHEMKEIEHLMYKVEDVLTDALKKNTKMTNYRGGTWLNTSSVQNLYVSEWEYEEKVKENQREIKIATENQMAILKGLIEDEEERQAFVRGFNGACSILGNAVALAGNIYITVQSGGMLLPVTGMEMVNELNVTVEGAGEVYKGVVGDISSDSLNILREYVFSGDEGAYETYGKVAFALDLVGGLGYSAYEVYSFEVRDVMKTWKEMDISSFEKFTFQEKRIYIKAIKNEGKITPELQKVVIKNGGYLEGLEYRLKSPSSVYEKIYLRPESTSIKEMNDIVRYTEIKDAENLVRTTQKTISNLESSGYEVIKLKNTWIDDTNPYNGINAQVKSPTGQVFELQFHTPESFALKNSKEMHGLYEQVRIAEDDVESITMINKRMFELSERLTAPKNIEILQEIRRN